MKNISETDFVMFFADLGNIRGGKKGTSLGVFCYVFVWLLRDKSDVLIWEYGRK